LTKAVTGTWGNDAFLHLVYLIFLRHFITDVYLKPPFLQKKLPVFFGQPLRLETK